MKSVFLLAAAFVLAPQAFSKTCVWVDSYHQGYGWSDGIEKGLKEGLKGKCDLQVFRMDTKRVPANAKQKGEEAKAFIDSKKPDVVIVSDDNSVKHILMPFFKDSKIPFVYIGVNWSGDAYGLPYKNTTGMIEVAPIPAMLQEIKAANKDIKTAVFLSVDNETEQAESKFTEKLFKASGIQMTSVLVKTFSDWKAAFKKAQESADLVYICNNAGINDWNEAEAKAFAEANTKKLSVSIYDWMAPYSTLVMVKQPEEQGAFGAKAAVAIMSGTAPGSIPVERNKMANPIVNQGLVGKTTYKFSDDLMKKAKKI